MSPGQHLWCDGSDAEKEFLTSEAVRQGALVPLNQESGRVAIITGQIQTMWLESSNSPISALPLKKRLVQQTIGRTTTSRWSRISSENC